MTNSDSNAIDIQGSPDYDFFYDNGKHYLEICEDRIMRNAHGQDVVCLNDRYLTIYDDSIIDDDGFELEFSYVEHNDTKYIIHLV